MKQVFQVLTLCWEWALPTALEVFAFNAISNMADSFAAAFTAWPGTLQFAYFL
ncbi:MAG: hypothetical protein ABRQ26_01680 [Syntrophomonadaceae bacterium]